MMALATIQIRSHMVISACVERVFKALNVSLIIDLVGQIHVGTMVNRHTSILHEENTDYFRLLQRNIQ